MKKEEFLKELESLLAGISEEERADALAFYRSYFEDAGEENESSILAELESPQKVAESILKDLGVELNAENTKNVNSAGEMFSTQAPQNTGYCNTAQSQVPPKKDSTWKTVLIILLAILSSPVWLTILIAVLGVLLGVVGTVFGIVVAAVAVMAALLIAGFVLCVIGIMLIPVGSVAAGIGLIGGGCLVFALGMLAVVLCVLMCGVFLPWAVKGIIRLCRKPFDKRRERAA